MSLQDISPDKAAAHWHGSRTLMWICLAVWFFFSFVLHLFSPSLNTIHVFGFPLGFYFAAQGSLIIFVVLIFWFANRQNRIDEEFGVNENE